MDDNLYVDSRGLCFCSAHRREVCNICCVDHRPTNAIHKAGRKADVDAILAQHEQLQNAEHAAMVQQHALEGRQGPVVLGSEHSHHLFEAVAARPGQQACAECGTKGDKLLLCSRCKSVHYCGKECQLKAWPGHKAHCKRIAQAAAAAEGAGVARSSATGGSQAASTGRNSGSSSTRKDTITWRELQALGGQIAVGKVLELRVMSQPIAFLRYSFDGKDRKDVLHRVAFYTDTAPPGLALGKIMRWRNPRFHFFLDGSTGARIEDEDLPNITFTNT